MRPEHTHNHCTPMQPVPNVGALRYLKDPVSTISELYARYPDGGEYGWFALCTDTNQFAVWNTETGKWNCTPIQPLPNVGALRYLKDPVATINELYARYPDGGEYGWFALCTDTNQFAVWNTETGKWKNSGLVPIEAYEESTQTPSANDYLLLYSVALKKAVKIKVSKISTTVLKSETHVIDTGDF